MDVMTINYGGKYQDFLTYDPGRLDLKASTACLAAHYCWLPSPRGLQFLDDDGEFMNVMSDKQGFVQIPEHMQNQNILHVRPIFGPWWTFWL